MTSVLNYSTHAISDLLASSQTVKAKMPITADLVDNLVHGLRSGVKFILPDYGCMFSDQTELTQRDMDLFKLPYPVVVCEYFSPGDEVSGDLMVAVQKRVLLAYEITAPIMEQLGGKSVDGKGGVLLFCMVYHNNVGRWGAPWSGSIIPYGQTMLPVTDAMAHETMDADDLLKNYSLHKSKLAAVSFPYIFGEYGKAFLDKCEESGYDYRLFYQTDCAAEVLVLAQMCAVLNCSNTDTEVVSPSAALQKKRSRSGKPPLFDYHVLVLRSPSASNSVGVGGHHASPRQHLRRGHIRRYETRSIWVNACVVGDASRGRVVKDYAIKK
jgi:hypothetical protein